MQMTIQEIGSIGELLGALAVLVTLIYLASQSRQTRIATQSTLLLSQAEAHARWRTALFSNPELAALLAAANDGVELSRADHIQLSSLYMELFISGAVGSYTGDQGGGPRTETVHLLKLLQLYPSMISEWQEQRPVLEPLAPEFVAEVNLGLERNANEKV